MSASTASGAICADDHSNTLAPDQQVVDLTVAILRDRGIRLEPSDKILDFGCGGGRHVYEFRDRGFNAHGVDNGAYAQPRRPEDASLFRSAERTPTYRLPYDDGEFSFVHSTSVFEHVMDYESAFREISRVLQPGGSSLHVFPARWRPIEPHMYVPFAGRFQHRSWFLLWALLGIRNEFQQGKTAAEVADLNVAYSRNGINYPTKREIIDVAARFFADAEFVEASYIRHASGRTRRLNPILRLVPQVAGLYRAWLTRVLLLHK